MAVNRDVIGDRGQWLASLALTERVGTAQSLFRPRFLGDKNEAFDSIVDLLDSPLPITPYFLVQVKATRLGYNNRNGNLRVQVMRPDLAKLVSYPAPTYIIGVDDRGGGAAYIVAALQGGPGHYVSLPTTHKLEPPTLQILYNEVLAYWGARSLAFTTSHFI
jgi:hypothetical protein